jgi:hypothetical protein
MALESMTKPIDTDKLTIDDHVVVEYNARILFWYYKVRREGYVHEIYPKSVILGHWKKGGWIFSYYAPSRIKINNSQNPQYYLILPDSEATVF